MMTLNVWATAKVALTWTMLARHFEEKQLIEIPLIDGHFQLLGNPLNALRLEIDRGLGEECPPPDDNAPAGPSAMKPDPHRPGVPSRKGSATCASASH
jgi:hypothetical protein